jgi:hypothetical protein
VELILTEEQLEQRAELVSLCSQAFGLPASAGAVTLVSRGTDDDVRRVLTAFGIVGAGVERTVVEDDECVTVTLDRATLERIAEGRLHTALEAALNCEVRIALAPAAES